MPGQIKRFNGSHIFNEPGGINLTMISDTSDIVPGQPVTVTAEWTVSAQAAGTDFPIGYASSTEGDDGHVLVNSFFRDTIEANSTEAAGTLVTHAGGKTDGYADFVAASSGQYATGVILKTDSNSGRKTIGILRSPVKA